METTFGSDNWTYVSHKVNAVNWLTEVQKALKDWSSPNNVNDTNQRLAELLDVDVSSVNELEKKCNLDQLSCEGEESLPQFDEHTTALLSKSQIPKDAIPKLTTLAMQDRMLKALFRDTTKTMSYRQVDLKKQAPVLFPRQSTECEPVGDFGDLTEIVFVVRVHAPTKPGHNSKVIPARTQEMLVLGSQTLDRLRDQIYCPNDLALVGEISENPDARNSTVAKDLVRSGMFYIEGTLYSDFRDTVNADYGEVISRWAAEDSKRRGGPFAQSTMETTKFSELTLRLGHPYLYMHLGECEHIITVTDIRLKGPEDIEDPTLYPLIKDTMENEFRYCMACKLHGAKWVTEDNERTPYAVVLYCDTCFKQFNYKDGQKVGNFNAYSYVQPTPDDQSPEDTSSVTIP